MENRTRFSLFSSYEEAVSNSVKVSKALISSVYTPASLLEDQTNPVKAPFIVARDLLGLPKSSDIHVYPNDELRRCDMLEYEGRVSEVPYESNVCSCFVL